MAKFTLHYDAGHGWLKVTADQLRSCDLDEADFSAYSYRDGDQVFYLEEDLDCSVFLRAWEAVHGAADVIGHDDGYQSWIRGLAHVRPRTIDDEVLF